MSEPNRPWEHGERDTPPRRQEVENGSATAALVLGILSFFALCLTGIPAIICALIALNKPTRRGYAIAGLILGSLGTLGGVGAGIMGYRLAENAASRVQDTENLLVIGQAFHKDHGAMNGFSGPYAQCRDAKGNINTGLSWRMGLLPYLGQDPLYKRFEQTEAWNSPKNLPHSDTPLAEYSSRFDGLLPSTRTPYRVFYGGGAMFTEEDRRMPVHLMTDGTSNTILAVHAWEQVPWAEPRELKYDPNGPLPRLGHPDMQGGFHVLMGDGSVRFVRNTISERTLRAAITRSGGEVFQFDD